MVERFPKTRVSRDTAHKRDGSRRMLEEGTFKLGYERLHHGFLKTRRHVFHKFPIHGLTQFSYFPRHCCFETAETEIKIVGIKHGARQVDRVGSAMFSSAGNLRPSPVAKTQELRHPVQCLPPG